MNARGIQITPGVEEMDLVMEGNLGDGSREGGIGVTSNGTEEVVIDGVRRGEEGGDLYSMCMYSKERKQERRSKSHP